jgi:hypothetical protein
MSARGSARNSARGGGAETVNNSNMSARDESGRKGSTRVKSGRKGSGEDGNLTSRSDASAARGGGGGDEDEDDSARSDMLDDDDDETEFDDMEPMSARSMINDNFDQVLLDNLRRSHQPFSLSLTKLSLI